MTHPPTNDPQPNEDAARPDLPEQPEQPEQPEMPKLPDLSVPNPKTDTTARSADSAAGSAGTAGTADAAASAADTTASPAAAFHASAGADKGSDAKSESQHQGQSQPIPPRSAAGRHTAAQASTSSTGWNGPGTSRPSYSASGQQTNSQHASSHSAFRPPSYAGQTHAQYGQPAQSAASGQTTHGSQTGASNASGGYASGTYGRPQAYGTPAASGYYGTHQHGAPQHTQTAGQSSPTANKRDKKRGRGARATVVILSLLLPIGIAAGVLAGYTYANQLGSYDGQAVEREVVAVLRDDYGLSDLTEVECPDWIKVQQGESFQCEFEYAGGSQTVTVTQGSQSGQLVVGAPE